LIKADNRIRWSKTIHNLTTLLVWQEKLNTLLCPQNEKNYLIPQHILLPNFDFIVSYRILAEKCLSYARILENPRSKVKTSYCYYSYIFKALIQLPLFEKIMVFCTIKEHTEIRKPGERKYYAILRKALFVKFCNVLFAGHKNENGDFISNNRDTNRCLKINKAASLLYLPSKKCQMKSLQNALQESTEVFFQQNKSLVDSATKLWMNEAKDYLWFLDKAYNLQDEDDTTRQLESVTLNQSAKF
jgi:hypothetical protein